MSKLKFVVLALVLSGCAAEVLSSGERTVVIKARSVDSAQTLAESECSKRGLHARFSIQASHNKYVFDCITL